MARCVLALDQGTTSSRAIVFAADGSILGIAQKEFRQFFPKPGWVEHDAEEIWTTQLAVAKAALKKAGVSAGDVAAIGITNQRETTLIWDRRTGKPVHHAIVWQDRRTSEHCDKLRKGKLGSVFTERTGLIIDAYFSGTKIAWLLQNVPGAQELAKAGHLAFGTIDSWLIWKLTGGTAAAGAVHCTDVTNASRTMIYDIHKGQWDPELLKALKIPASVLPEVRSSSEVYGETSLLGKSIPVAGIAGDQQAALFGQMCTKPGMAKNTYGTGCFMLMNIGTRPKASRNNLLTTVAWKIGSQTEYAFEGSVFVAGAAVQWLRDGLGIIRKATDVESLAASVPDNGGVYIVPAFAGLGAPHWDQYARGTITGLTRGATAAHLARATLESIAFQVADVLDAMKADAGLKINSLRVDGGAATNNMLMQFQADILGVPVVRPTTFETTAMGAAYLAGLSVGFWKNRDQLAKQWQIDRTFEPSMKKAQVTELREGWNRALERSRDWAKS
ncbi:MAG: glycerol kinase GlpK [Planctomycetaceae bacterium]|nr:glycerol kinase GlpK [Planctomycetaceae bacterium]